MEQQITKFSLVTRFDSQRVCSVVTCLRIVSRYRNRISLRKCKTQFRNFKLENIIYRIQSSNIKKKCISKLFHGKSRYSRSTQYRHYIATKVSSVKELWERNQSKYALTDSRDRFDIRSKLSSLRNAFVFVQTLSNNPPSHLPLISPILSVESLKKRLPQNRLIREDNQAGLQQTSLATSDNIPHSAALSARRIAPWRL